MLNNRNSLDNEKMSSVDYWKQISQHLKNKKSEEISKNSIDLLNFDNLKETISKIVNHRINTVNYNEKIELYDGKPFKTKEEIFFHNELENSYTTKPIFSKLNTKCKIKHANVPYFFPKRSPFMFSDPSFFKKFDLDTLFFIFYYSKGTVQQTYAAIRLKSFAWRFHLKYQIWFQRLDEPKLITVDYEKGEFLFFDYESTWNFMKKNDFVFEYCYLEHNDHY